MTSLLNIFKKNFSFRLLQLKRFKKKYKYKKL